jgi:hypothetical protein
MSKAFVRVLVEFVERHTLCGSRAEPRASTFGSRAEPQASTFGSHAEPRASTFGSRTERRAGTKPQNMRALRVSMLALGALGTASCIFIIEPNKTQCEEHSDCEKLFGGDTELVCVKNFCALPSCTLDEDCTRFGSKYEGTVCIDSACKPPEVKEPAEWACLDTRPEPVTPSGPHQIQAHFQHMVSQSPMKDVTVRVCRKLDVECSGPESMAVTDAKGDATLTVPSGFTGYMAMSREDLMPTRYYFSPAVNQDLTIASVQLVELPLVKALVMNASEAPLSDDRGLILVSAFDCMQVGAAGIEFASADADDESNVFYAVNGQPSITTTETQTGGFGGFLNAPTGNFTIDARRTSDGRAIGAVGVLVRPGELTITRLVATYQIATGP